MFYSPFKSGVKPSIGIDLSSAPLFRLSRILGHSQRVLENFKDSFLRCAHTLYPLHDRVGVPMTKQDSKEEEEREQYSLAQKALLASSQRMRRGGKRGGLITPPPVFLERGAHRPPPPSPPLLRRRTNDSLLSWGGGGGDATKEKGEQKEPLFKKCTGPKMRPPFLTAAAVVESSSRVTKKRLKQS